MAFAWTNLRRTQNNRFPGRGFNPWRSECDAEMPAVRSLRSFADVSWIYLVVTLEPAGLVPRSRTMPVATFRFTCLTSRSVPDFSFTAVPAVLISTSSEISVEKSWKLLLGESDLWVYETVCLIDDFRQFLFALHYTWEWGIALLIHAFTQLFYFIPEFVRLSCLVHPPR
jgi:hypothetical protein